MPLKNTLPPSEVRRFRCSGLYMQIARQVASHIHKSREGDRMPSQPTGMKKGTVRTKKQNGPFQYHNIFSEKVYTGQTSLSIDRHSISRTGRQSPTEQDNHLLQS
jgi:hypothetical protein